MAKPIISVVEMGAKPNSPEVQTAAFQAALDKAFVVGGATVEVPAGRYYIGGVRLRSNTTLLLRTGAEIYGTRNPEDYCFIHKDELEPLPEDQLTDKPWEPFVKGVQRCYDFMVKAGGRWNNGIIRAFGAENIAVIGEPGSIIDGQDCYDEIGEERYRGPHGISMHQCHGVTFKGYTIRNTGDWAHSVFFSTDIYMDGVTVLAGHDGIHCTCCTNLRIMNSEFYTGDDCVAGFGNVNTLVSNCICNTACSGLRFGGTNALIRDCKFYGPAKHFFRGSLSLEEKKNGAQALIPKRVNMLSVFTYYADFSVDIPEQPGNIVIENCTVDNVDRFLHYNYSGNERWQAHRPLESVKFENIQATGIGMPLTAYGAKDVPITLTMRNIAVSFREEVENTAFLHTAHVDRILLENVAVNKRCDAPLIKCWTEGGDFVFRNVSYGVPEADWVCHTEEPFVCKAI